MTRNRLVSKKEIDARYWRNVEIQDTLRRRTFVDFVKPLKAIYRDPVSAGAFLLSAYSYKPAAAEYNFKRHRHFRCHDRATQEYLQWTIAIVCASRRSAT